MGHVKEITFIIVPGYDNSGPSHWQSHWEKEIKNSVRVKQRDWQNPDRKEWIETLDKTINAVHGLKILVAHSMGCNTVVEWANTYKYDIKGAMLVAPPDLESLPPELANLSKTFVPISLKPLPFPSILIASGNDQYCKLERAEFFAKKWNSKFINIGNFGHINAESNLGSWLTGRKFLKDLY